MFQEKNSVNDQENDGLVAIVNNCSMIIKDHSNYWSVKTVGSKTLTNKNNFSIFESNNRQQLRFQNPTASNFQYKARAPKQQQILRWCHKGRKGPDAFGLHRHLERWQSDDPSLLVEKFKDMQIIIGYAMSKWLTPRT